MSDLIRLFSPAKINLFLAVTGRRADGFHEIVSIISKLEFGDTVTISIKKSGGEDELYCQDRGLDCGPDNLILRAARSFFEATGLAFSVVVRLEKRIPLGAGLGGGSSNAAATLRALNKMCGEPLGFEDLVELGSALGSDVPLFLRPGPAFVRGRGEIIEALPASMKEVFSGYQVLLFAPRYPISTTWAYAKLAERAGNYVSIDFVEAALAKWSRGEHKWNELRYNSFEAIIRKKFIDLDEVIREVESRFGIPCLLSGSGSTSFILYRDQDQAAEIKMFVAEAFGKEAFVVACGLEALSNEGSV